MKSFAALAALAVALAVTVSAVAPAPAAAQAGKPGVLDGKAIFTAQKCDMCHAVSAADIKATGKVKAKDISAAELKDATVLGQYLRKKAQMNGKNHIKTFNGTDEELGALIAWMQKQAVKK